MIFSHYSDKQQGFLDFILSQYIQEGVGELGEEKLPTFIELKYGTPRDAVAELGQVGEIREMFTRRAARRSALTATGIASVLQLNWW